MSDVVLFRVQDTPADIAKSAIEAVVEGWVDPIVAYTNISKMEAAIATFKKDDKVKEITMREIEKYPKNHTWGDVKLEIVEAGVKYDYSECGDSQLAELYRMRQALDADIKEREAFLKSVPISGVAIPDTGEMVYPPEKTSKTTIKTTIKK